MTDEDFEKKFGSALRLSYEHLLTEARRARAELRTLRLAQHAGSSCGMLAARLVAVEAQRDRLKEAVDAALDCVSNDPAYLCEGCVAALKDALAVKP